ncbi:MAG: hypothetical protein JWQ43_3416 [Glaciihabitans sp.]|nr:hypothetical protein [Glaciihabitans sp.]
MVEDGYSMSDKQDNERRDEFDVVRLPAFFDKLPQRRAAPEPITPAPDGDDSRYDNSVPDEQSYDSDKPKPVPGKWYAGARGKTLIYGAGMIVMLIVQIRN